MFIFILPFMVMIMKKKKHTVLYNIFGQELKAYTYRAIRFMPNGLGFPFLLIDSTEKSARFLCLSVAVRTVEVAWLSRPWLDGVQTHSSRRDVNQPPEHLC